MESVITIIGSIASILGAVWSFVEARKSKSAAKRSEEVRDELIHRRRMVEVSQVHAETKRILRTVSKVGPSCNARLLKGVNCADIAREVDDYVRVLLEQSEHFSDLFDNTAKTLCSDLRGDIEGLAEAESFEDKKRHGKSIYYQIQGFMPAVKQLSDEKREQRPTD